MRRGEKNVILELTLISCGFNLYKYHNKKQRQTKVALNCLAACLYLMLPAEKITERMATLEPVAMRLEVKEGKNGCLLINDSYNSDLASLDIALDFLYRRSQSNGLKRTLILSDILETGQQYLMEGDVAEVELHGVRLYLGEIQDVGYQDHQQLAVLFNQRGKFDDVVLGQV